MVLGMLMLPDIFRDNSIAACRNSDRPLSFVLGQTPIWITMRYLPPVNIQFETWVTLSQTDLGHYDNMSPHHQIVFILYTKVY